MILHEIIIFVVFSVFTVLIVFVAPIIFKDYGTYLPAGNTPCQSNKQFVFYQCSGYTPPVLGKPCLWNTKLSFDAVYVEQACISENSGNPVITETSLEDGSRKIHYSCPSGNCPVDTITSGRIVLGTINLDNPPRRYQNNRYSFESSDQGFFLDGQRATRTQVAYADSNFTEIIAPLPPEKPIEGSLFCPAEGNLEIGCENPEIPLFEIEFFTRPGECFPPGTCSKECQYSCLNIPEDAVGYVLTKNQRFWSGENFKLFKEKKSKPGFCEQKEVILSNAAIFYPSQGKVFVLLKDRSFGWKSGNHLVDKITEGEDFNLNDEIYETIFGPPERKKICLGI